MSRRHGHRNTNKVKPAVTQKQDTASQTFENIKPGHETFKDEDYTDEEIFESINTNCAHMLMSLGDDDEEDQSMTYDEIVELLKKAPASNPNPAETDNKDERP